MINSPLQEKKKKLIIVTIGTLTSETQHNRKAKFHSLVTFFFPFFFFLLHLAFRRCFLTLPFFLAFDTFLLFFSFLFFSLFPFTFIFLKEKKKHMQVPWRLRPFQK